MKNSIKLITMTTSLLIGLNVQALTPAPSDNKPVEKVFINANIHVGNGQVLNNAQFAIAEGVIKRVGYYKMAFTGDEIDLKDQHIYPGFILTDTNLGLTEIDGVRASIDATETGLYNTGTKVELTMFDWATGN